MRNYKIMVAYDGTDYKGWQVQPNAPTVCSALQDTFQRIFGRSIKLLGASRTDAGVHALGQVARFQTDLNLPASKILSIWNDGLPQDILIRKLQEVSTDFHPLRNVLQKTYYYHLFFKKPLPFVARYGWHYEFIDLVDLEKFNNALQFYIGEHDFSSFCKCDTEKSCVRTIDSINLQRFSRFGVLQITVKGKSFLRFQIRRMIGYALDVARRSDLSVNFIKEILDNPNPEQELLKAGGSGLCLRRIIYL